MTNILITPATELALTLAAARLALRIDGTELDGEITGAILGITQELETTTGQCLMPQVWRVQTDTFPCAGLPLPHPATALGPVTYRDTAGSIQTLDPSKYRLIVERYMSVLVATTGNVFPATDSSPDAVKVNVTAGIAEDADSTPAVIKMYIELKLKQQFDPAARVEKDTLQSNFADGLLQSFKVKP